MPAITVQQAFTLAVQYHRAGRLPDAEALYRRLLAAQPEHSGASHLLGVIASQAGRQDLAVEYIRQAIASDPNNAPAYYSLGDAYFAMGRLDEAVDAYRRALEVKPDYPEVYNSLGLALSRRGQADEAIAACRHALELKPDFAQACHNLGLALAQKGALEEAVAAFRRAVQIEPNSAAAHNGLGIALIKQGRVGEAVAVFRRALALKPDDPDTLSNLANALKDEGRVGQAVATLRRALQFRPADASLHSDLICTLHFDPDADASSIAEEHRRWSQRFGHPPQRSLPPWPNERSPDRRLRIGYVSPAFCDHVVGRNLVPLFRGHDRQQFEIVCYSGAVQPDSMTAMFREWAHEWRNTVGVADEAFAAMVREDRVDILVDLTQHLGGNRLPVFARQPAPVQVSFAGYPAGTGLEAISYRISDPWLEECEMTEGASRSYARSSDECRMSEDGRECVFRIDTFWCYDPCGVEVAVNDLPAGTSRPVTFGNLNHFFKVNDPVLRLWARVLTQVEDSRLVLLSGPGSHRERTLELLAREGIEARRVEFVSPCPRQDYLALYHLLDIVLDPFPYGGHTTSLDAVWMGVPVVSLVGESSMSRAGLSILSNLGLPELAASSQEDYVRIAVDLARDLPRLAALRRTLRSRMEASALMDAPRFARQIETAYRAMWRRWCARG